MKKPLTDEDLLDRASIDGRVSFAMAAFALGAGLVALLDRVGVPEAIVGVLGPVLAMAGLALIGLLLHAVRVSRYYAAGRAVPPPYAGLALAALVAALLVPFLPPASGAWPLTSLFAGFAVGLVAIAFLSGPLVRKSGAFSLPDLISGRFPHVGVRLGAIAVVGAASLLLAMAGLEGAIRSLSFTLGVERMYAALMVGVVIAFVVAPGGMSGIVWAATGAAGVFAAALFFPLALTLGGGEALPAPVLGDPQAWSAALASIGQWHDAGAQARAGAQVLGGTQVLGDTQVLGGVAIVAAVAIGTACLAPLLSPAIATAHTRDARRSGASALVWSSVALGVVALTMAASAGLVQIYLTGERPDRLPAFAYVASASGLLQICGASAASAEQAFAACRDLLGFGGLVLRPEDLGPQGLWLLLGLADLSGFGAAFAGLAGAGVVAVSLVFAAAGFQAFGTAVGHDGLYRVRNAAALASPRLAMTRLITLAAVAGGAALLAGTEVDARQMIALAIFFSTAALAPLVALALWPRASGSDAAIALLAGLLTAGVVLALRGGVPDIHGLSLAALVAATVAFAAGVGVSFLHRRGLEAQGGVFVHGLLHGESDVLNRDRDA